MTTVFQNIAAGKIAEVEATFVEYRKTYMSSRLIWRNFINSIKDIDGILLLGHVKDVEMAKYLIDQGCDPNVPFLAYKPNTTLTRIIIKRQNETTEQTYEPQTKAQKIKDERKLSPQQNITF